MRIIQQASGIGGIYQTVQQMKQMINEASIDPLIRRQAYVATAHCDRYDDTCKAYSILGYAKQKIEYIHDPATFELLQHPKLFAKAIHLGRRPYGDCDDFSMYIASLCKAVGLKPVLRVISLDGKRFHHVYVRCGSVVLDGTTETMDHRYLKAFDVII